MSDLALPRHANQPRSCAGCASWSGRSEAAPRPCSAWRWWRRSCCWPPIGPWLVPDPADATGAMHLAQRLQPPSPLHWFGTDEMGDDIFTRVVIGTRTSLWVGLTITGIAALIGVPLGVVAGYRGRHPARRDHARDGRVPRRARAGAGPRHRRRARAEHAARRGGAGGGVVAGLRPADRGQGADLAQRTLRRSRPHHGRRPWLDPDPPHPAELLLPAGGEGQHGHGAGRPGGGLARASSAWERSRPRRNGVR